MTEAAFFSNEATFGRVVSQLPLEWGLVARNTKYWLFRCLKLSVPPSLSREWEGLKSELITSDLMKACLYNETFLKIPKWWGSGTFWGKKKKNIKVQGKQYARKGSDSSILLPPNFALWISFIWLFLSCIVHSKLVTVSAFLSSKSLSKELLNLSRDYGN